MRHYRGRANPDERVIINRDANNQYDSNAIKVNNVMGAQIGHIPRQMAAKLASYMVKGLPSYCFQDITNVRHQRMLAILLLKAH